MKYILRPALVVTIFTLNACVMSDLSTLAPSEYETYQALTKLFIPIKGESAVIMGGRTPELNYHTATDTSQRFALDISSVEAGTPPISQDYIAYVKETGDFSMTYSGDPKVNESYYCYGKEVIAPADGVIVKMMDGIKENTPGKTSLFTPPLGNHVVIDHGNNEYSVLAHLKLDSIMVSINDEVKVGDEVGKCGNSGHSRGPHLHYQLQDGPDWTKANGLPAKFYNYIADEVIVQEGEPVQGQILRNQ